MIYETRNAIYPVILGCLDHLYVDCNDSLRSCGTFFLYRYNILCRGMKRNTYGIYMIRHTVTAVLFTDEATSCAHAGYFTDRVMKVGKIARAVAILSHPIPGTDGVQSAQIILPQKQIGRKNDMYVFCCSFSHNVCAKDKWIAFVSTTVETTNPEAELAPGDYFQVFLHC
jgi:hypothetical protein